MVNGTTLDLQLPTEGAEVITVRLDRLTPTFHRSCVRASGFFVRAGRILPHMSVLTRLRCVIRGDVQGVGFRWSVRERARDLGLTGFVRNLPDESVEVVAEGSEERLAQLEAFCRKGPDGARVTGAAVTREPAGGAFEGFEIR